MCTNIIVNLFCFLFSFCFYLLFKWNQIIIGSYILGVFKYKNLNHKIRPYLIINEKHILCIKYDTSNQKYDSMTQEVRATYDYLKLFLREFFFLNKKKNACSKQILLLR